MDGWWRWVADSARSARSSRGLLVGVGVAVAAGVAYGVYRATRSDQDDSESATTATTTAGNAAQDPAVAAAPNTQQPSPTNLPASASPVPALTVASPTPEVQPGGSPAQATVATANPVSPTPTAARAPQTPGAQPHNSASDANGAATAATPAIVAPTHAATPPRRSAILSTVTTPLSTIAHRVHESVVSPAWQRAQSTASSLSTQQVAMLIVLLIVAVVVYGLSTLLSAWTGADMTPFIVPAAGPIAAGGAGASAEASASIGAGPYADFRGSSLVLGTPLGQPSALSPIGWLVIGMVVAQALTAPQGSGSGGGSILSSFAESTDDSDVPLKGGRKGTGDGSGGSSSGSGSHHAMTGGGGSSPGPTHGRRRNTSGSGDSARPFDARVPNAVYYSHGSASPSDGTSLYDDGQGEQGSEHTGDASTGDNASDVPVPTDVQQGGGASGTGLNATVARSSHQAGRSTDPRDPTSAARRAGRRDPALSPSVTSSSSVPASPSVLRTAQGAGEAHASADASASGPQRRLEYSSHQHGDDAAAQLHAGGSTAAVDVHPPANHATSIAPQTASSTSAAPGSDGHHAHNTSTPRHAAPATGTGSEGDELAVAPGTDLPAPIAARLQQYIRAYDALEAAGDRTEARAILDAVIGYMRVYWQSKARASEGAPGGAAGGAGATASTAASPVAAAAAAFVPPPLILHQRAALASAVTHLPPAPPASQCARTFATPQLAARYALEQPNLPPLASRFNAAFQMRLAKNCMGRGSELAKGGDTEMALAVFSEGLQAAQASLALYEPDADAHKLAGILYSKSSRDTKAQIASAYKIRDHTQRAVAIRPSDPVLHHVLGLWCFEVANLSYMMRTVASVLFATPPTSSYDEAIKHLQRSEELATQPDYNAPMMTTRLTLARAYYQKGNKDQARHWIAQSLKVPVGVGEEEKDLKEQRDLARKLGVSS